MLIIEEHRFRNTCGFPYFVRAKTVPPDNRRKSWHLGTVNQSGCPSHPNPIRIRTHALEDTWDPKARAVSRYHGAPHTATTSQILLKSVFLCSRCGAEVVRVLSERGWTPAGGGGAMCWWAVLPSPPVPHLPRRRHLHHLRFVLTRL